MPKRYKVIGSQPVLDHQPDTTFNADLPEDQERFLVQIGALRVVSNDPASDRRRHPRKNKKVTPQIPDTPVRTPDPDPDPETPETPETSRASKDEED
jgi:hypothetical protein